jgi:ribose transport system ATP-binding protein
MRPPLFRLAGITKSFGATRALAGVSFEVAAGEVRALVGENGAGKSTLLSILAGAHRADAGSMVLAGAPFAPNSPRDARRRGVAMIHQELAIAPDLSLAENIALGSEASRWGVLNRDAIRGRARESLARLSDEVLDVDRPAREFSLSVQQQVEIARALSSDARVLVLDEPTSSLGPADADRLFRALRALAGRGLAVVVVTHFLEELPRFADSFTVLRDGAVVAEGPISEASPDRLVRAMSGRSLEMFFPRVPHTAGEELLAVEEPRGSSATDAPGISLSVRRGEILGLAGLVGAGRSEFLRRVFGLDPPGAGRVRVGGRELTRRHPRESISRGLGLLSEDRKTEGLAQGLSLEDNLTLSALEPYARWGWLSLRRRREAAGAWLARLACKPADPRARVAELSGGNQQKVAFARLLHQGAQVLLLDEPTRGVDVATKAEIYQAIGEEAARGKAVVMASSHFPELLHVCDRIAVFQRGHLRAVAPASQWSESSLLAAASGVAP